MGSDRTSSQSHRADPVLPGKPVASGIPVCADSVSASDPLLSVPDDRSRRYQASDGDWDFHEARPDAPVASVYISAGSRVCRSAFVPLTVRFGPIPPF